MMQRRPLNSMLTIRLKRMLESKEHEEFVDCLQNLSHSDFRSASVLLADSLLVNISEEDYWSLFRRLLEVDSKAFLGTVLKAAVLRLNRSELDIRHNGFLVVSNYLNTYEKEIDKRKILERLLPCIQAESNIEFLFERLHINDPRKRIEYLVCGELTMAGAFVLFKTLRFLEHDKPFLTKCCRFLMKKGGGLSFNLASLIKVYFDLQDLNGTFSLRLQPYETGRIETSYEAFLKVMSGV